MDEPKVQEFPYPFSNDKQVKIYWNLHNIIGQGSAAFYRDACCIININPPLDSTTHIIAHLFREIESSLRSVLKPVTNIEIVDQIEESQKQRHKADILSILKSLEISENEPVAQAWLKLADSSDFNLAKRAHRSALAAPRKFDKNSIEFFNSMDEIFYSILDRVRVRYLAYIELLDILLSKPVPIEKDIDLLLNNIPQNYITMGYFFRNLKYSGWLKPLRDAGFFKRPSEIVLNDEDVTVYSQVWPESNYLSRIAEQDPNEVADIFIRDVPFVKNVWVLQDLADAALNMSPDLASRLIDKIKHWVQEIYPLQLPNNLTLLIMHIAKSGKIDCALGLARVLFEIMPDPRTKDGSMMNNSYPMPNPTTRFEIYDYGKLIHDVFPKLIELTGIKAFEILCDILDSALTLSKRYPENDNDLVFSYFRRPSIEGPRSSDGDIQNILISIVRDCAEQIVQKNEAYIVILVQVLDSRKSRIFHRIALHILRKFPNAAPPVIVTILTDKSLFGDLQTNHEYTLLFRDCFKTLNIEQRDIFLNWISVGPDLEKKAKSMQRIGSQRPSDEELSTYRKAWQRDRLSLVQNILTPPWKEIYENLVKEIGEPNSLDNCLFQIGASFESGCQKNKEDLKGMPINEIANFLKNWVSPDDFYGPSKEAMGSTLSDVIAEEPEKFAINAMLFKELDTIYIKALFWGLKKSIEKGNSFNWPAVLDLSQWVIERSGNNNEPNQNFGNSCLRDLRRNILELLISGFDDDHGRIPLNLRTKVWPILKECSSDLDPMQDRENKRIEEDSELSIFALSTIRGQALIAIIRYVLWIRNCTEKLPEALKMSNKGFDLTPEVREILNSHLNPDIDPSLAIRAIYGMEFSHLKFLDCTWASENANIIFPTEESKLHLWNAAWRSYLQFNRAYSDVIKILEDQYLVAIDRLEMMGKDSKMDVTDPYQYPECRVVEHIMYLYWWGKLDPDDGTGLFSKFWSKAPGILRAYALHIIGFNLCHSDRSIPSDVTDRLRRLWESRLTIVKNNDATPDELKEFGWWFASGKFDENWSIKQLIDVLGLVGEVELDFGVLKILAVSASQNPNDAIQCLNLIIRGKRNKWQLHSWRNEIKSIIGTALKCNDLVAAKAAKELTNYLSSLGYLEYKDLLK